MARICFKWLGIALLSLNTGCTFYPFSDSAIRPYVDGGAGVDSDALPAGALIDPLPFFAQTDNQCGPAAMATLLAHRQIVISPEQLRDKVYLPGRKGTLQVELLASVRPYELLAYKINRSLSDLLKEVNAGNPVLVMLNMGFSWRPKWHYAVVKGYQLDRDQIILQSGKNRHKVMGLKWFLSMWSKADYWAAVVTDPGSFPATVDQEKLIIAINQLEQVNQLKAARRGYQAMLARWPTNHLAAIGLANTSYTLGAYEESTTLLKRVVTHKTHWPVGWNNLSYSLQAIGCRDQAIKAAACAVKLSKSTDTYAKNTLDKMSLDTTEGTPAPRCKIPACPVAGVL